MSIATVSSKGQITLPSEARKALGIRTHDRVRIRVADGAIVIEPVPDFLALQGVLGPAQPREEERAAVEEEAVRRARAWG